MIDDYITDTLEEYPRLYVQDLILGTMNELGCTREEVEEAIIRLEEQGKVRGYILEGGIEGPVMIEAVP